MNLDVELARFCHWMLTLNRVEAAIISREVRGFREDKEKVAAFTVMYYRSKNGN